MLKSQGKHTSSECHELMGRMRVTLVAGGVAFERGR
jgi:hypothetical protein